MVPRDQISIRLSPAGLAKVQQISEQTGTNRSAVIRRLLAEALASDAVVKATKAKLVDHD